MNKLSMLPALPFGVAIVAGMFIAYFFSGMPQWLSLVAIALCTACGGCLLRLTRLCLYPILLACLFVGIFFMTRAKTHLAITIPTNPSTIVGTIIDTPRPTARRTACLLYVHDGALAGQKVRVYLPKEALPQMHLAMTYELNGYVYPFRNFGKDTHFNYRQWAESHSLSAQINVFAGHYHKVENQLERLPFFERVAVKAKLLRVRILQLFAEEMSDTEQYALIAAMAFGERNTLPQNTRDLFARTGVSHLLALSGLHLSILYMLLAFVLFRWAGRSMGSGIALFTIWLYVLLVGMPVSAVRAATMLTFFTFLAITGRTRASVNILICTVVIMLLCNPLMIWDMGFQLSVVSVLSIAIFYRPIYRLIDSHFLVRHFLLRWFWGLIVISLSATIGATPLVIYYFGLLSPYFILTNLVAVPLVTALLYGVVLSLVVWWLPPLRHIILWIVHGFITVLDDFLRGVDRLPGTCIDGINISVMQLFVMYLMVAALAVIVARGSAIFSLHRAYRCSM